MKLLFFDLETTGLDYKTCAIHQLSGQIIINDEVKETFDFKIKPFENAQISKDALEKCNVSEEQIQSYPEMREVYNQFIELLSKYVDRYNKNDKFFLCGYNNMAFDNQFLRQFFELNRDKFFGSWFWSGGIDIMVLSLLYIGDNRPKLTNFRLSTVAKYLGIEIEETMLHNAQYDIELTKQIYYKIKS